MKIKKIICLGVFISTQLLSLGQELTQVVKGKVIDKDSKTPIFGANIIIQESNPILGASSDLNGYFTIQDVPVSRVNIKISAIGYETQILPNIVIESGKETNLNIELIESFESLKEFVVSDKKEGEANNEMAIVSSKQLTTEATGRYAGSLNDPARMVTAFAGVVGNASGDNDIVVRGNSPRGILWRLEGVEIPNPNHFGSEGSSGGPVNTLNGSMLANSDFFSGAFAPEYGNALSGVFDSKFRVGNHEKREHSFSFGVLGLDATVEGPFSKNYNGSYLVNFRYSSLDLLDQTGIIDFDGVPKYYDGSFKFNLPTKSMGNFVAFGLFGRSSIKQESGSSDENGESEVITEKTDFNAGMSVFGLKHFYNLKNGAYIKSYITLSNAFNGVDVNEFDSISKSFFDIYDDNINENHLRISTSYNSKFNTKSTLNVGVIYTQSYFDMKAVGTGFTGISETYINDKGNGGIIQGYTSWKYRIKENVTLVSGLHYTQLLFNGKNSIEPRAGLRWNLNKRQYLTFGTGLHSRVENSSVYFANTSDDASTIENANKNLKLTKAAHFVIGYGHQINENISLKTEVYYQHLYDVPVSTDVSSQFSMINSSGGYSNSPLTSEGTGKNYGVELTLERFFSKGYYYMATGSLYESKYTPLDNVEYNSRFNANYAGNILFGKEFKLKSAKKNKTLALNLKATLIGGNRYTPIDLQSSIAADETVYHLDKINESKLDDIFILNFALIYRINKKKTTHEFKLDIQNVTNNQATVGYYYNDEDQKIESFAQLSILPNIMYVIKF